MRRIFLVLTSLLAACDVAELEMGAGARSVTAVPARPISVLPATGAPLSPGTTAPFDDALIISQTAPDQLACSAGGSSSITVRNTGTTTWTAADQYRLGAWGDSDPFASGGRQLLGGGETVAPGEEHTFTFNLNAPAAGGSFTSGWQMVKESVHWFGGVATKSVDVACAAPPPPPPPPPPPAQPVDLNGVTIFNSPDVSGWPATATITHLELATDGVHIDFTKRDGSDSWPDVPFGAPGDSLEYTLWIVIPVNGQWFASGCIEYWRGLDKNGGPPDGYAMNWYYDSNRWHDMTGHQPQPGDPIGFLVSAGDARNNGNSIVQERSNVVWVSFPTAAGAAYDFP